MRLVDQIDLASHVKRLVGRMLEEGARRLVLREDGRAMDGQDEQQSETPPHGQRE
jgi:hypothetical protein